MAKRTEREFHIALGKLLDRVRVQNSWSKGSFHDAAKHVANVSPSEAVRFFKALTKTTYLKPGSDKRRLTQNFNASIWKNQDAMLAVAKSLRDKKAGNAPAEPEVDPLMQEGMIPENIPTPQFGATPGVNPVEIQ